MSYLVTFTYFDGTEVPVSVALEDIEKFLDDTGKGDVYFNNDKSGGLWINSQQVRFFQARKVEEALPAKPKENKKDKDEEAKESGQAGRKLGNAKRKGVK
jgi:hypothetical protein